jgi:hypothetical protein
MIHINPEHLTAAEIRQARYLAAVADLRAGQLAYDRREIGERQLLDLVSAVTEYDDIKARSLPLAAAAAKYNVPRSTLKHAAQFGELESFKQPSAAGGRDEWWIADDERLAAFAERVGQAKRGRPRKQ